MIFSTVSPYCFKGTGGAFFLHAGNADHGKVGINYLCHRRSVFKFIHSSIHACIALMGQMLSTSCHTHIDKSGTLTGQTNTGMALIDEFKVCNVTCRHSQAGSMATVSVSTDAGTRTLSTRWPRRSGSLQVLRAGCRWSRILRTPSSRH